MGVWLLTGTLAIVYVIHLRALSRQGTWTGADRTRAFGFFLPGLMVLHAGLDWPLGALGSGYLASIHMVQYLLVGLIAPPLLLLGIPRQTYERLNTTPRVSAVIRDVTSPLVALFVFNVGVSVTHWPGVVDFFMATQLGAMTSDLLWVFLGFILWWPIIAPVPARPDFKPWMKLLYLGVNIVIIRPPVLVLLFSEFPAYAIYELAPPILGIDLVQDQQFAGGIMKVGSSWIMFVGMSVIFYRWWREAREV